MPFVCLLASLADRISVEAGSSGRRVLPGLTESFSSTATEHVRSVSPIRRLSRSWRSSVNSAWPARRLMDYRPEIAGAQSRVVTRREYQRPGCRCAVPIESTSKRLRFHAGRRQRSLPGGRPAWSWCCGGQGPASVYDHQHEHGYDFWALRAPGGLRLRPEFRSGSPRVAMDRPRAAPDAEPALDGIALRTPPWMQPIGRVSWH